MKMELTTIGPLSKYFVAQPLEAITANKQFL